MTTLEDILKKSRNWVGILERVNAFLRDSEQTHREVTPSHILVTDSFEIISEVVEDDPSYRRDLLVSDIVKFARYMIFNHTPELCRTVAESAVYAAYHAEITAYNRSMWN
jgi:hypothetical protein